MATIQQRGNRDIKILLNTYYAPDMAEVANLLS